MHSHLRITGGKNVRIMPVRTHYKDNYHECSFRGALKRLVHRPGSQLLLSLFFLSINVVMAQDLISGFEARTFSYGGEEFRYRLRTPKDPEPGKKYPLLLFLHGAGERGSDNAAQLRHLPVLFAKEPYSQYEAYVLVPQCREGKRWVEVDWGAKKSTRMTAEPSPMLAMAMALLEKTIAESPVDPAQILLAGISMGGYGAWELTARKPNFFAGVLAICGGGDEQNAPLLAKTPFQVWHGSDDKVVPPQRSRSMVEAVQQAGGSVKFTELPGVGHDSWTTAFKPASGAIDWLFQQRR